MRTTDRVRALAIALGVAACSLAAAPAAAQAAFSPSSRATAAEAAATAPAGALSGVYRITLTNESIGAVEGHIVLEPLRGVDDGALVANGGAWVLKDVRREGDELRARVRTAKGDATLVIRAGADGISGTLTHGEVRWQVSGDRPA